MRAGPYTFRLGRPVYDWMEEFRPRPLAIPEPPFPYSEASADRGARVYREMRCASCHGPEGKGDGPAAAETRGNLGETVLPTDYTRGARWFKGGSDAKSIVRTLLTGLHGTPMPSFATPTTSNEEPRSSTRSPTDTRAAAASRESTTTSPGPRSSRPATMRRPPPIDENCPGSIPYTT